MAPLHRKFCAYPTRAVRILGGRLDRGLSGCQVKSPMYR
jgi:hypothetical protein